MNSFKMPFMLDSRGRKYLDVEDLEGQKKWQWDLHVLKNFEESLRGCADLRLDVRNIRTIIEHNKREAKKRFPDNQNEVKAMIFGYELFGIVMEKCRVRHPNEAPRSKDEKIEELRTYIKLDQRFDEICASMMMRTDGRPNKCNLPTNFKILLLYQTLVAEKWEYERKQGYRMLIFHVSGLARIHSLYNNHAKAFYYYYEFGSIISSVKRTELDKYEEDFLHNIAEWMSSARLDPAFQDKVKELFHGIVKSTKTIKTKEMYEFRICSFNLLGEFKTSLKWARRMLKEIRNPFTSDFVAMGRKLRDIKPEVLSSQRWIEPATAWEVDILLKIAHLHIKMANYELALQTYKNMISTEEKWKSSLQVERHCFLISRFQSGLLHFAKNDYDAAKFHLQTFESIFTKKVENKEIKDFYSYVMPRVSYSLTKMLQKTNLLIPRCEFYISKRELKNERDDPDKIMKLRLRENSTFVIRHIKCKFLLCK